MGLVEGGIMGKGDDYKVGSWEKLNRSENYRKKG